MTLIADGGANADCKPINLVEFAGMSNIYAKKVLGIENPRVALANVGLEEGKGNDLTKSTFLQLKNAPVNFIGNIEGRDVMEGNADVMTCDGFVGNVILKTVEGMGHVVGSMVKGMFKKSIFTKIGALFVYKGINDFKKAMDYREYGGAPLLGTRKPVIKGHGSSDVKAAFNAMKQAEKALAVELGKLIEKESKKG